MASFESSTDHLLPTIIKLPFSPIHRLPLEVLGEVFLWTPESDTRPNNYQRTVAQVSLVCKRWRDAAQLSPRLWRDIWVQAGASSVSFEGISSWIARAGNLPTHLEISSPRCRSVDEGTLWDEDANRCRGRDGCLFSNPVFHKLLTQAPAAWHSVTFDSPSPECLHHLVAALNDSEGQAVTSGLSFKAVQVYEISTRNWSHWTLLDESFVSDHDFFIPPTTANLTLHLPAQGTLAWSEDGWAAPLHLPAPRLQHLTSLTLTFGDFEDISASPLLDALQHCSNLEALSIDCSTSVLSPSKHDQQQVVLPNLRRLFLLQYDPGSFDSLRALKMPALWSCICLSARTTICENLNPLRFLHITAASFYGDVLFHLLRGLHSLTRLKLDWIELRSYTPDDSFSNLTTHTPLCLPNLKTVEILNLKHSPEYQIPSLRSFVKERNIDLTLTYHDHEAALEEKWVEDGRDAALEASCWDQKYWKIGVSSPSDSD
ncbi:hypothetical protein NMY22_g2931 [Coprinellus aureogranulatus]|nr:hypothetical protein NMY22_g2931 [Coprinellus aureogranulatus]